MTLEVLISHRRRKKNISHKGNVPHVCNRPQCLDNILYIQYSICEGSNPISLA